MWPFTRKPRPLVLIVTNTQRNEAYDTSTDWPLKYIFSCLVCGNEFTRVGNKTANPKLKAGRATCVKCGASRTLRELHEDLRLGKELQLLIEQEEKKIDLLKKLQAVKDEREALEKGLKRVVEA